MHALHNVLFRIAAIEPSDTTGRGDSATPEMVTLGALLVASGGTITAAAFLVTIAAEIPTVLGIVTSGIVGWSIFTLQRFLVAQRTTLVCTSAAGMMARAFAVALRWSLVAFLAIALAQPIAVATSVHLRDHSVASASVLGFLAAVPAHDWVRWLVTVVAATIMLLPLYLADRRPTDDHAMNLRRRWITDLHAAHRRDYERVFLQMGQSRPYPLRFEDPPFNRIPISPDHRTHPKGALLSVVQGAVTTTSTATPAPTDFDRHGLTEGDTSTKR